MKQLLFIGILVLIVSCNKDNSHQFTIDGKDRLWLFSHFVNNANLEKLTLPEGYCANVRFGDGQCICLNGPCNSGEGVYRIVGNNRLSFEGFALTERGCNILGFENMLVNNFSGVYTCYVDTLYIDSENEYDLVFLKTDSIVSYSCDLD